jgi:hypothetical protein
MTGGGGGFGAGHSDFERRGRAPPTLRIRTRAATQPSPPRGASVHEPLRDHPAAAGVAVA